MHRLFVAIRPPAPVRDRLLDLMEGVGGARWQGDDQLHLTLRFVGEVDPHRADDLYAALSAIRHPPFTLSLDGLGIFESRGRPNALWAGVAPHAPLRALHKKIDLACQHVGLEPERRAYLPHITLARIGSGAGSIDAWMALAGNLASGPFTVEAFCLFESELSPAGAIYSLIERYPLS